MNQRRNMIALVVILMRNTFRHILVNAAAAVEFVIFFTPAGVKVA